MPDPVPHLRRGRSGWFSRLRPTRHISSFCGPARRRRSPGPDSPPAGLASGPGAMRTTGQRVRRGGRHDHDLRIPGEPLPPDRQTLAGRVGLVSDHIPRRANDRPARVRKGKSAGERARHVRASDEAAGTAAVNDRGNDENQGASPETPPPSSQAPSGGASAPTQDWMQPSRARYPGRLPAPGSHRSGRAR